jgi:hypothetical protein
MKRRLVWLLLTPFILQLAQKYGVTCERVRASSPEERAYWVKQLKLSVEDQKQIYDLCFPPEESKQQLQPWLRK